MSIPLRYRHRVRRSVFMSLRICFKRRNCYKNGVEAKEMQKDIEQNELYDVSISDWIIIL